MPEENWAHHGGIPACDFCYTQKVKCDRQDPCMRCTRRRLECTRTRTKSRGRQIMSRDDRVKELLDKMQRIEGAVRETRTQTQSAGPSAPRPALSANEDSLERAVKRLRTEISAIQQNPGSSSDMVPQVLSARSFSLRPMPTANEHFSAPTVERPRTGISTVPKGPDLTPKPRSEPPQLHRDGAAREHIEKELSHNESLKAHQRKVFETALAFIDQLSQAPASNGEEGIWGVQEKVDTDFTKGELLQIILASQQADADEMGTQLFLLDHIPPTALERIAFTLLERKESERTLNLCKVIVHFKAALGLYASQLQSPKDKRLREHVKEMQLRHLNAALTALDGVGFSAPPSLLLVQGLLTGAILTYIVGNSISCWSLTAYASRTLVALGYHNIRQKAPKTEQEQEIHAVVAWCYHFDRVMSLLLLRPSSLPPLQVPISSLIPYNPRNPMAIFAMIMLELVPIHEKILELTLAGHARKTSTYAADPVVNDLRNSMDLIHSLIQQARANIPTTDNADYELHWYSLEFKFFSTLTAVHRLSNTVCSTASEREKCLSAARRALQCVKSIRDLAKQQDHFLEEYNPYLAWTILSYPLSPFFVLFCNVVGTSDAGDFQLLQDVVDSMSSLGIENKYVERLKRLCNTLLALCKPLVQQSTNEESIQERLARFVPNSTPSSAVFGNVTLGIAPTASSNEPRDDDGMKEPWQDDMMFQLFQCQPTLDWFNSDLLDLDLESWDLNLPS